jgi:hypothetical protein
MQRSSDPIACLAAALAKAQAELMNPEKSLVATIRPNGPGEAERSFRYAPLSGGLEIVRKALGNHEIATMQTMAIDQTAGIVILTTVLAHSSGEWVASDWPVGPISETATPHRMGAALTCARRYALFTLVGIAGEDDIDAPDLNAPTPPASAAATSAPNRDGRLNGGQSIPGRGGSKVVLNLAKPILGTNASATLRDQLICEVKEIASSDDAANWAHRILRAKNSLTEVDAKQVEAAFQAKLVTLEKLNGRPSPPTPSAPQLSPSGRARHPLEAAGTAAGHGINKSQLTHPEPRRFRDKERVSFVAKQACLICGRRPADAHHLRFAQHRALGLKVSDEFIVPLCRGHHREAHRSGDEAAWWNNAGVAPTIAARALWLETHPVPTMAATGDIDGLSAQTGVSSSKGDRPIRKAGSNLRTNPTTSVDPQ